MQTFTKFLLTAGLAALGSHAASAQVLYDNFEDNRLVTYGYTDGTLAAVANPGGGTVNTSATSGKYDRSTAQYAVIVIDPTNAHMADVSAYSAGTKQMTLKFRSPGPGTVVQLVLQNKMKAAIGYPNGNYGGLFSATTTAAADTWETLTFTYAAGTAPSANSPGSFDPTVMATAIDQMVMQVAPNTTVAASFYLDDITGPELVAGPLTPPVTAPAVTDQLYDNYEGTRVVKYNRSITSGGFKIDTLNPAAGAGNTSAHVLRYTRSNQQYDVLFLAPVGAPLADVTPFLTNAKQMTMKVYSPAAGTVFQITLQDSVKARGAYPLGRHSEYTATTKGANAWETLTFSNSGRPDKDTPATGLNEIVLLIAPGTTIPGKFYIDDWTGPHLTNYVATATRATSAATLASVYPNPAAGAAHLPYSLQKAAVVSLAVYDALGRRATSVFENQTQPAGEHRADLNTAGLAPGLYTCRLVVDGAVLTRQLSVQ